MLKVALLVAMTLATHATGAAGQQVSTTSGAHLLNACRDLQASKSNSAEYFLQGYCLGVVDGVAMARDGDKFCFPEPSMPRAQIVRIVVAYVERNPALQHLEFASLITPALAEVFPGVAKRR